jgi:hypothetical protein
MTPAGGQLAALGVVGLLALAKLVADAFTVPALSSHVSIYQAIQACVGDCPAPSWFAPNSREPVEKEWKRLANLRLSTLSTWRGIQHANLAFGALALTYVLSWCAPCVPADTSLLARFRSRDGPWIWVCTDLAALLCLGVFGVACAAALLALSWPLMVSTSSAGWATEERESIFAPRTCTDLGNCT